MDDLLNCCYKHQYTKEKRREKIRTLKIQVIRYAKSFIVKISNDEIKTKHTHITANMRFQGFMF